MGIEKISAITLLVLVIIYVVVYIIPSKEIKEEDKPYILMVKIFVSLGACIASFLAKSYVTSIVALVFVIVHSFQMYKFKKGK
jgi:Ca2+-dependent lipid-binding protein